MGHVPSWKVPKALGEQALVDDMVESQRSAPIPLRTALLSSAPHTNPVPMTRTVLSAFAAIILLGSCVSKKKYTALQGSNATLNQKLADCNISLDACNAAKASAEGKISNLETSNQPNGRE